MKKANIVASTFFGVSFANIPIIGRLWNAVAIVAKTTSVNIKKLTNVSPTSFTFPVIDVVIGELITVHRF